MSRARILAVDDQRYFRELIEGLLDDAGYSVATVGSGEEALHLLEAEDFDVVLTDLVMPGMDGGELVGRIKERLPEQDIVMVTGVVDVQTAVDAMKQGAVDYILKPFDRVALLDSLERILGQRRLRDEHARLMEENLEFMGVLSLFERVNGLYAILAVEPLIERLIEGLCLETRAQSGVLWAAEDPGRDVFTLVEARGLVRAESEPESVRLAEIEDAWCPGLSAARSVVTALPEDADGREALFLPIRANGVTLAIARLSDRLDDSPFEVADRAIAEKFCEFGGTALHNAMRFRALERRSLRDPDTRAYSRHYYEDAVRNEIQKAQRFVQRFTILGISIEADRAATKPLGDRERVEAARRIEGSLRATDLLASGDHGEFLVLLPQTDSLGAGVLTQRMRLALDALWEGREAPVVRMASATYPVDGTQLEALTAVRAARMKAADESLLATRPEFVRRQAFDPMLDRLLELGSIESTDTEGQILSFVLEEVARRPADRGVLFLSPGVRWLPEVLETLHDVQARPGRTEIVLLAEGEEREPDPRVTWVTKSSLDSRRPFLVYFGDGPAYAMVGQVTLAAHRAAIFQTSDRALVEHLAFDLQRELGIVLPVEGRE